jgi:sterol desaturase/sphingolipid hydroxylase (fatty acid hydroxylase superfamily)
MFMPIIAILLGAFTWTFAEYALHNWVFHGSKGKNKFNAEHLAHHARTSYFAPAKKKVILALIITAIMSPVAILLTGTLLGFSYVAGYVAGYVLYEVIHRRTHTHAPRGPYGRWARKHHMHHHFHSPKMNHGVTSPLWDVVFHTYEKPGLVRVPKRQAMRWLIDQATGDVVEKYAGDYHIGRLPSH